MRRREIGSKRERGREKKGWREGWMHSFFGHDKRTGFFVGHSFFFSFFFLCVLDNKYGGAE